VFVSDNVVVLPVVSSLPMLTDGTTGWVYVDVSVPGLSRAVVGAFSLTLVVLQKGANGNDFEWNVGLIGGYNRDNENDEVALSATNFNTNDVTVRTTPYDVATNFLLHSRLRLCCRNRSTVTGVQGAVVSVTLLVKPA